MMTDEISINQATISWETNRRIALMLDDHEANALGDLRQNSIAARYEGVHRRGRI